eukprot:1413852-Amphidinium_carterae.1
MTAALGGLPRLALAAADSQSAPESTWASTSSVRLRHRSRFGSCRVWRGSTCRCASRSFCWT